MAQLANALRRVGAHPYAVPKVIVPRQSSEIFMPVPPKVQ
jgi:hypothetical protein